MIERNAVRRALASAGGNASKGMMAMALTLSLSPATAFAQTGDGEIEGAAGSDATNTETAAPQSSEGAQTSSISIGNYTLDGGSNAAVSQGASYDLSKIADGKYQGTAVADSNDPAAGGNEWEVDSYEVKVTVQVASGKITSVKVSDETYGALTGESGDYLDKAENGNARKHVTGMADKIVEANGTSVDAVSTATVSSNAIKAAVDNALQVAYDEQNPSTPATDEYTYGYAGLTWAEYWAAEGVQAAGSAASSGDLDSRSEADKGAFDAVTRATANHGLHRGSYQCMATIYTNEGATFELATWAADGKSFTTTDGKTVTWNRGSMTCDGASYTLKDYEVTGLKYVPVKVKTSDLDAFKATHRFVPNGETLAGGYGEGQLSSYSGLVADVDADTNGLKTVTVSDGSCSFSAAAAGTDSGIKDQTLKTADLASMGATVKEASGSYGEFLRVDFTQGFGDLGANMQAVTWTYYGDDATRSNALATFGTKFAADNWMHKSMGIQLGLTDSLRCQLPAGTNGTGYWRVTVHALGYADASWDFQATDDNIVGAKEPATEATKAQLKSLYNKAAALDKTKYTEDSWKTSSIETETAETKELLEKADLSESEAAEQITHLQGALDALVSLYPEAGSYVLMNIPYSDFYAAEQNNSGTDVVTSATKQKTLAGSLVAGSYHVNADGSDITGATFAVKVGSDNIDWSKFKRVTDSDSIDITTSIKGKTSTTTYSGRNALFQAPSYSYYVLPKGETPANYKEVTVGESGNLKFSAVEGKDATALSDVTAEFTTDSKYGDYEIDFSNLREKMADDDGNQAVVYGAVVNAADETGTIEGYGMRALENIWKGKELAWSCGFVTEAHGSPLSSKHYESMMGKTIKSVVFYTSTGTYTVAMNQYVPVKVSADEGAISIQESASLDDASFIGMKPTLPGGFDAQYSIEHWNGDVEVSNASSGPYASVIKIPAGTQPGSYTIVATDKSGKYAPLSATFTLTTAKNAAAFDASNLKLIADGGASASDLANYLGNISQVTVNGVAYSAKGKGAVKIVNQDGSLNLAAANKDGSLVFDANGAYDVEVEATGYTSNLKFTYAKVADKAALESAVQSALKIDNNEHAYTATSWTAFQAALNAARGVNESVSATDEEVASALSALQGAQAALVAAPNSDQLADLRAEIEAGSNLKEADYTSESWAAYQQAVRAAEALFGDEDTSAADVESATAAVKQAREQLVKPSVENPPASDDTGKVDDGKANTGTKADNNTGKADDDAKADDTDAAADKSAAGTDAGLVSTGDVAPMAATGIAAVGAAALAVVARFMRRRTRE